MSENWYAFCLAICTNKGADASLRYFGLIKKRRNNQIIGRKKAIDYSKEELQALRDEGLTYKQIGEKLGVSKDTVWKIINKQEVYV